MADSVLDVSQLAPPEPLERILAALETLQPGDRLRVIHRREPFPLYELLPDMGYTWETTQTEGRVEILIWAL